jgi:hypothetical protein
MSRISTNWRLVILGALIGVVGPSGYRSIQANFFNARELYSYQGTEGPFEGIVVNGELTAGRPITAAHPGDWIAWRTTICFDPNVLVTSDVTMRPYPTGTPVNSQQVMITPKDTRCGPKIVGRQVPMDAADGNYVIDRLLVLQAAFKPPVSVRLPSVEFRVTRP